MKHILLIATGGTIACRERERGLTPVLTGEELLEFLPEIRKICRVTVVSPFSVDSTDMTTAQRRALALLVWENHEGYDGFVIAHGTDSLSYTSALLHHMLRSLNKPVIITGSHYPIGDGVDAEHNMRDAFRVACAGWRGVFAVLHGQIMLGNHVVKVRTQGMDAFQSVGALLAGTIRDDGKVIGSAPFVPTDAPHFVDVVQVSFVVLRLVPDLDPALIDFLQRYDKVILESYGAGGLPVQLEEAVQKLLASGTKVYIASQCLAGGVNLRKYAVGRRAEAIGAISLGKRTIEDAIAAIQCGEI